jgi:hypothetical protein
VTDGKREKIVEKELLELCKGFLIKYQVRAPESPYQMDDIIEAAPELVEAIAEILGYYDDDTGELNRSK